jgi:ABC-type nitrate/sulfonate/bicarbonate transport system substrate-binding protein
MTQILQSRRSVLQGLAGAASTAFCARAFALAQTKPEVGSLVVAPQFGIIYLPLHVIKAEKLLEKHLTKNGLPNSKVDWVQMTRARPPTRRSCRATCTSSRAAPHHSSHLG